MLKISNVRVYGIEESIVASGYPMLSKPYTEREFIDETADVDSVIYHDSISKADLTKALKSIKRAEKLGSVPSGTGHDNYLRGIIVQYDVRYPVYWTPQFQRYTGYNNIVSSMSSMHRLTKMNLDESMNEYVLPEMKWKLQGMIDVYNEALSNGQKTVIKQTIKKRYNTQKTKVIELDNIVFFTNKDIATNVTGINLDINNEEIPIEDLYMYIISNCPQGLEKTMRVSTNYLQLKTMWHQRRNHKLKDWQVFCDEIEKLPYFKELTGCGL